MPMIRVREKHQITLPKEVVVSLSLKPDSYIEYSLTPDGVLMRPVHLKREKPSIFQYSGYTKQRKQCCFATAQQADQFISNLRDEWER